MAAPGFSLAEERVLVLSGLRPSRLLAGSQVSTPSASLWVSSWGLVASQSCCLSRALGDTRGCRTGISHHRDPPRGPQGRGWGEGSERDGGGQGRQGPSTLLGQV